MNKAVKITIGLMIATIASKVMGFGREIMLASAYGTSFYADAYIIASNMPVVIFSAIGTSIGTTFIPLYYENNKLGGEKRALNFSNNILNLVGIVTIILAVLGYIYSEQLVKLFAIGFTGETLRTATYFTKIMVIGIIFIGIRYIITAFLQVKNNFIIPGLLGIPYNIIIIISIILSTKINPYILPFGTLIAMASQFLFQIPFAYKKGYRYKPYINIKDEYIRKIIWLVGPVFIGSAVDQINFMIDRTLASTLAEGSISALNYANKLNGFVTAVFIASVASVIYPMLSKLSNEDNKNKFNDYVVKSINSIIILIIPISVGAIVLANPIVKVLFERGAFDSRATSMTAIALVFYSIGMIGFGLRDVLGKVYYSLQDTKTPMIIGIIAMVINIVLNIILANFMKHSGIALATSISSIICTILMFISLKKKIGYFGQDKIIKTTLKSIISSIIMGLLSLMTYKILINILGFGFINESISLFGSIVVGILIYSYLINRCRVEEVDILIDSIKHIKKNK